VITGAVQDDAPQKDKLAKRLCLVISRKRLYDYQQEVHLNWVSRNQSQVEVLRLNLRLTKDPSDEAQGE
jgi:hypothetical protein